MYLYNFECPRFTVSYKKGTVNNACNEQYKIVKKYATTLENAVPIRPNITESKPQLNPGITFWVYSEFTTVDADLE